MSDTTNSTTDAPAATQTAQGTFIPPATQAGSTGSQQQPQTRATGATADPQAATQPGQGDGTRQGQDGQQEAGKGSKDAVLADLAKERDRRQETEQKLDAVLTALGLKQDDGKQVDPQQAAADLAATRAENAVLRVGAGIADVDALLDSRTFTETLARLDVADRAAVKAHIEAFVQANPRYAAQAANQGPVPAVRDAGAGAHLQTTTGSGDWLRDAIRR